MLHAGSGLTNVPASDLRTLLRAVHREEIRCPLTIDELARHGLQHCAAEMLGHLRGLEAAGVRAVVVAVIAERR
jgi:hypothetical protein